MRRFFPVLISFLLAASATGTAVSVASASTPSLPTVTGAFDRLPHISFPSAKPPTSLVAKVLHMGNGPVIKKKNLIVVNYVGQIWRGKVFDSSYTRPLFGTAIGVGQVLAGWDVGLVGKRVGSRVLLVIPPKDGYGPKGQAAAGIKGTDTLAFVVDIVADYTSAVHGDLKATPVTSGIGGVSVSGPINLAPKITVRKGDAVPKSASITLLSRGHGAKIKPGLVILQTLVTNWSGVAQASTWAIGSPDAETVGQAGTPSILDKIVGQPIGSRFLALAPKSGTAGPYAIVFVVVAQPHGTPSQPS